MMADCVGFEPCDLSDLLEPQPVGKPSPLALPLNPAYNSLERVPHSVLWPPVSGFILLNMECYISSISDAGR